MRELDLKLEKLNPQQREAVESVDGPLLVVAGPGTGKTQLLGLRAANILATRDVRPRDILCLTFSDAGAEAMRKRLVSLIGRDAYGIEVATFHAFAQGLRTRYPEHFERGSAGSLVSDLARNEIVNGLLCGLPASSPLFSIPRDGKSAFLGDILGFIGTFKKSGLSTAEYRSILEQDLAFFDFAEKDEAFMAAAGEKASGGAAHKEELCARFEAEALRVCGEAAATCGEPVATTPGSYVPYPRWLAALVRSTELIDEDGRTAGLKAVRTALFGGTAAERVFKDRKTCGRALAACDLYDAYQAELGRRGLYDYDDMILDAIATIEDSPELADALRDRYEYVQVDEFQDTNGSQMRILELLAGDAAAPNLMAVCDDDQAIMRFQGASVECIRQFGARWRPKTVVLKTNYRSTPAIVGLGKHVASQIEGRLPSSAADKDIEAFRPQTGDAAFAEHACASRDLELAAVAQSIKEAADSGFVERAEKPDEAIAVIAPKHEPLRQLLPHLAARGVPFAYRETANVLTAESMQTLLACLRYVAYHATGRQEAAEAELPRILAAPELEISRADRLRVILAAHDEFHGRWANALGELPADKLRVFSELSSLVAHAEALSVGSVLLHLARLVGPGVEAAGPWSKAEFQACLRALVRFAEGELEGNVRPERALRITDVVDRLDEAQRFGLPINATFEFGRPGAVRLTTAHGSKGLEFDRVYLLDADDDSWHKGASSTRLFPQNMLVGSDKDEDDARRLLFVALTRAKTELSLWRAGGRTLRELEGVVETVEHEAGPEDAAVAIQVGWAGAYVVDQETFASLLAPGLLPKHLSASALNAFATYRDGEAMSETYQRRWVLGVPVAPNPATAFGSAVHALMEDYVNKVLKGGAELEEVVRRHRDDVLRIDASEEERASLASRYDRVAEVFVPTLAPMLKGRVATEVALDAFSRDGVPLYGACDLLLVDDEAKTVRVLDYKTGFNYPGATPTPDYERQLQFYKLLIEGSDEFAGYTVVEAVDLYVEPERGTADTLHDPARSAPNEADLDHLQDLITAVWARMQSGDFDVSGFEESEEKAAALAAGGRSTKRQVQRAFEDWLISGHSDLKLDER